MRCDEYSEWDEYIGLDTFKRIVENAISTISTSIKCFDNIVNDCPSQDLIEESATHNAAYLDVARAALVAMRNQLDKCTMNGTIIKSEK